MTKDELFEYLASEENEHGLDPVAAHGFLSATVVGKPLNHWLSVFFEGHENAVPDDVKTALVAWREELIATLKNEEPLELPFGDEDEVDLSDEGDIVAWCIGFVDAMYGDENSQWFDDPDTEEDVADLTLPMIVLSGIADEDEELTAMREDEDVLLELVNSLEDNLTELFLLFHTEE
ncbi:MAG: YecA family protein [Moraxella sp.]|nr:YecA family protein [Moraxella sp.]